MPLLFEKEIEEGTWVAVWDIEEDNKFFRNGLVLDESEEALLDQMNPERERQWLTSRFILKYLLRTDDHIVLTKNEYGKPIIENRPEFTSLSHSGKRVAAVLSNKLVGIDIQEEVEKMSRIHPKFISKDELKKLDRNHLVASYHIFWGCKEAMYKAYGLRQLAFREHMHIYPFKCFHDKLELSGWVRKGDIQQDYQLFVRQLDEYYLCVASIML